MPAYRHFRRAVPRLAMSAVLGMMMTGAAFGEEGRNGADIFSRCQACHALAVNSVGPRLCGVVGRKAGSVDGFNYSRAMQEADFHWDRDALMRFLENPMKTVRGTKMGYAGIKREDERRALIGYLEDAAQDKNLCT